MKRWTRFLPLLCLWALVCATLAAAEFQGGTSLNCHEMSAMRLGAQDGAELLGSTPEEAALSGYFAAREAAYCGKFRLLSADDPTMSAAVIQSNGLRAERVREMETRLNFTVLDADVTTSIDRERTVRNPDGTQTLYVYEWTYYDYDDLSDGEGGLDVSGFGTWHVLTVAETPDGSFEILADEYDESDILGLDTLSEERRQELQELGLIAPVAEEVSLKSVEPEEDAASLLSYSYYPEYDVTKVVAYSEQYWQNYNPAYHNFNDRGGDCANFTSQSIAAGGMPQVKGTDGWYYTDENHVSSSWISSTNMRRWMGENRGRLVSNAVKKDIFTGSPVFYSTNNGSTFRHTVLCVGTNTAGNPIINSHNNDRYHFLWNYYVISGQTTRIDTVQLTSNSFGSFSGYVKLNANFYAYIVNPSLRRYVSHDGDGNVTSRARTELEEQVWRFVLQSDGSYQILSAKRGTLKTPALATVGGSGESRTYVHAEEYVGSSSQQWYFYQNVSTEEGSQPLYQLRPKCSDRVLDIFEANADEGTPLWIFTRQTAASEIGAQLFRIDTTEWVMLDDPVLQVDLAGTESANVTLFWEPVTGAASYTLVVTQNRNPVRSVTFKNVSYALKLAPGVYEATVQAISANGRTSSTSEVLSFTVPTSYTVTYYANGGTAPPEEQLKLETIDLTLSETLPTYPGYDFSSWNTKANGTGDFYTPGTLYSKDESLELYAQWTPATFTVKLDANHGSLGENPEELTVKYKDAYGELPEPTREQFEFAGWYTELDEGDRVTEETTVLQTQDHTLYAHWDSTIPYISSVVTKTGDFYMVHTSSYRIDPEKSLLIACGYLGGQMASVVFGNVGDNEDLTLEGEFDTIRVMALDNEEQHLPLCPANVIPQRQFR